MMQVGCNTESQQMIYITNLVFICQFFNTGILPMLLTANLENQFPLLAKTLGLTGQATDFNSNWFINIGDTIVSTLKANIFFPIVIECVQFCKRLLIRWWDKRGATPAFPTKCRTIKQYVNKYTGPEYSIHYKYSAIMNSVYLTMMFGPAMPILFPICFATLT
jgi:hypothetical protein